jgi:predicted SnoaL-like aldol condensation-catalyzing enzyme
MSLELNKKIGKEYLDALIGGDQAKIAALSQDDLIQHNPTVPTGPAALIAFAPALKESGITLTTHRILAEGDLVALHNEYQKADLFGAPALVTFDIFRIVNGKIAEHWDNLQPIVPKEQTKSGRSMLDGPTEVMDFDKTAENKDLIKGFIDNILIGGAFDKIVEYISTEQYDQHNPNVGDALAGIAEAFPRLAAEGNAIVYHTNHMIIAEGNFVLAVSEGTFGDKLTCFQDLFRVENGKIVEHWDCIASIPETMAHDNGYF